MWILVYNVSMYACMLCFLFSCGTVKEATGVWGRGVEKVGRAIGNMRYKNWKGIMGGDDGYRVGVSSEEWWKRGESEKTNFVWKMLQWNWILCVLSKILHIVSTESRHSWRPYKGRLWGRGPCQLRVFGEWMLAELRRKCAFSTQMCLAPLSSKTDWFTLSEDNCALLRQQVQNSQDWNFWFVFQSEIENLYLHTQNKSAEK